MAITGVEINGKVISIDADNDLLLLNGNTIAGGISEADKFEARQVRLDTTHFDKNLSANDEDLQKAMETINHLSMGIDGKLDTTQFNKNLKDAAVEDLQGMAEYVDTMITALVTPTPELVCNDDVTESTDAIVTIANWDSDTEYVEMKVTGGTAVNNNDGTITWSVPPVDADTHHTMTVKAKAEGRGKSDMGSKVINVLLLVTEHDDLILYEGATMTTDEFPHVRDTNLANSTLFATANNAYATSATVAQDESDKLFTKPYVKQTSTAEEYTIGAGSTKDNLVVEDRKLYDGDMVWIGDTDLTWFDTKDKLTVVSSGGGTPGENEAIVHALDDDLQTNHQYGVIMTITEAHFAVSMWQYDDGDHGKSGKVYLHEPDGTFIRAFEASDKADKDAFGYGIAMTDTKICIAAPGARTNGTDQCGCLYLYDMDGSNELIIKTDDDAKHYLGRDCLVMTGDKIIAGAPYDDETENYGGAVYCFDHAGTQLWKIAKPGGAAESDQFGGAVATDGSILLVGNLGDDAHGGEAYVYDMDGNHQFTMNTTDTKLFGLRVAIGAGYLWISAAYEEIGGVAKAGAVYRYDMDGSNVLRIPAPEPQDSARFGYRIAAAGDKLMVAEYGWNKDDDNIGVGRVYVMDVDGNTVTVLYNDGSDRDYFGTGMTMTGSRVAIGSTGKDVNGKSNVGEVRIYDSGASSSSYELDISSLGLADVPQVLAKRTATTRTWVGNSGTDIEWYQAEKVSSVYDSGKILEEFGVDGRKGDEFCVTTNFLLMGQEVTRLEIPIEKVAK